MENGGSGTSPCGACKFLRRKCAAECVFAPYFRTEVGPARFAAVHKVFGASNASKLLQQLPFTHRHDAVLTIAYEAQARIRDPVRGCVAHILSLQQQVFQLQAELLEMRAKVAAHQWPSSTTAVAAEMPPPQFPTMQDCFSDYSSSIDGFMSSMQSEIRDDEEEVFLLRNERKRRRVSYNHLNELQQMAFMMMKNAN